jgi:hypothetical protein
MYVDLSGSRPQDVDRLRVDCTSIELLGPHHCEDVDRSRINPTCGFSSLGRYHSIES